MHVVVIGCGRVGSELAGALELAGHTVAVIDKNARAFRRLPADFRAARSSGFGFDRDHLAEAGHRRGRRVRVGDERRQLQHPLRPHRARDVRDRTRRRPHLRPAARAHLPTPRHPDRRDRRRGRPTRCCAGCSPTRPATTGSTRPARSGSSSAPIPPAAVGHKLGALNKPGPLLAHRGVAVRSGPDRHRRHGRPGRRRAHVRRARWTRSTSSKPTSTPEAITDAGRDRGRRQRRPVHRQRPRRHRPRGAAHRAERRRRRAPAARAGASSSSSPTRAR